MFSAFVSSFRWFNSQIDMKRTNKRKWADLIPYVGMGTLYTRDSQRPHVHEMVSDRQGKSGTRDILS